MARILFSGNDLRLLGRWVGGAEAAGHESLVAPLSTLRGDGQRTADVALVDLGPRGGADTGALLAAVASVPQTRFVAMTARPDAHEGLALLRAGVRGYCNRLAAPAVADALLASVLDGEIWAGRQVTDHLLALAIRDEPAGPPAAAAILGNLTAREAEIANAVAAGHSNKVIAAEHGIAERTVKVHLNRIFRKTGMRNRVQLALALNGQAAASRRLSSG